MAKNGPPSFDVEKVLAKVGKGKTIRSLKKGDTIFSQGEIANTVYYVQSGNVKLTVTSERGKEAIIAILGPGNFVGEGCLNGQVRRMATASAVDECVLTIRHQVAAIFPGIHILFSPAGFFVTHCIIELYFCIFKYAELIRVFHKP